MGKLTTSPKTKTIKTIDLVPKAYFLTRGVGYHRDELTSFELALRDAGISSFNLVKVSSIVPPNAIEIPKEEGLSYLNAGEVVFVVMSENKTNEYGRLISSSVGIALPKGRKNMHGYLAEYHDFGITESQSRDMAERIAATMLLTLMGYEVDHGEDLIPLKDIKKFGEEIETSSIASTSYGKANGIWTTVVAAAVFLI